MNAPQWALRGDLLDFTGEPGLDDVASAAVRYRRDHWLLVREGRIVAAQLQAPGEDWLQIDHGGRLILPGFIDTHVHSAQVDVIGSWGTQLLDWLETHTFPAEQRMAEPEHALHVSHLFLHSLLAHGTTAACVFPTVHAASVEALFEAAKSHGMRLIAGKLLMDRNAPPDLCDEVQQSQRESRALIQRWHGQGRAAYAVTPRFAPTSSDAQLAMAGSLVAEHPGIYVQTHVAENQDEVRWVHELFPAARSYLDVYAGHGLLNERAILAHGIWLDDADRARLHDAGAQIAFCPSSNLFLGSGLFGWHAARAAGVNVSLASDVGGGTSLSMRRTMLDAYKVQAGLAHKVSAFALLHAATRGAAHSLQLGHEMGSFEPGAMADLCVWDWACTPLALRRQAVARDLHEKLFAWVTLGDEHDLVETWVAGERRWQRG
jgi:guanine deaminase